MKKTILTTFMVSGFAISAQAGTISLNFVRAGTGVEALAAGDVAGVSAVGNWNNAPVATANSHAGLVLTDDAGIATSASADWTSGSASWSVATAGAGSAGDKLMMTGYLDQGGNGAGQIHNISITGIPFASYDVYLYHSSSGGANRTARYQANGSDIFTRNLDPANTFDGFTQAGYGTLADAANVANPAGNYVLWSGLSGDLTMEGQGLGAGTVRAPIQGIQIVERVPEPGSAMLLFAASFMALGRRKR
jgi:hypothetical protein